MEVTSSFDIDYTTEGIVPVRVVTRSLLAHERLITESLNLLCDLYPGLGGQVAAVRVELVANNSPLREVLAGTIVLSFQSQLAEEIPEQISNLTGFPIGEDINALVTVGALLIALYGAWGVVSALGNRSTEKLEEEIEDKIEVLAKRTGKSCDEVRDALGKNRSQYRSQSFSRKIVDFFAPARNEKHALIKSTDADISLKREAIDQTPIHTDVGKEDEEYSYPVDKAYVEIHRSDIDNPRHGWRAVIRSISDRKVPMQLPEDAEARSLYGVHSVIADVAVLLHRSADSEWVSRAYRLIRIHEVVRGAGD